MNDQLRIYVIWHPNSPAGGATAEMIAAHFDGLGMERDGVAYRVPVRFRSEAWDTASKSLAPREIHLEDAKHNAIVFLHDEHTAASQDVWDAYVGRIRASIKDRKDTDVYIPFLGSDIVSALPSDGTTQYARQYLWAHTLPDAAARNMRLLLHILHVVRTHLQRQLKSDARRESLFVSHAKADGDDTAWSIVDYLGKKNQDVPLDAFYDAKELMPGDDYQQRFTDEISGGTLLAIVSDLYESRPWCVFELTEAKRHRRPIVLADVGRLRTTRTYPYGANLPKVRFNAGSGTAIESLLVEALSEGLRCDLFLRQANEKLKEKKQRGIALPRPPELFDLMERSARDLGSLIVYPDPPLSNVEQEIIDRAVLRLRLKAKTVCLGELS